MSIKDWIITKLGGYTEDEFLAWDMYKEKYYSKNQETKELLDVFSKIGYDFRKLSLVFNSRHKDFINKDIELIEELMHNLHKNSNQDINKIKIEHFHLIEKALYQILRNYSNRDNKFIEQVIQDTRIGDKWNLKQKGEIEK